MILVAEDEAAVRNVVIKVLLRAEYGVLEADSAAEAGPLADPVRAGTADMTIAIFAATTYSSSDPNAAAQYASVTQRVGANLDDPAGQQSVTDIEARVANAQTAMTSAQSRHQQTSSVLTNFLQSIEGVDNTQVGTQILALQTQLQASLQTTALLSKISIVNFISG